jgi:predicted DNA-binding transcriptional regulator YafY
MAGRKGGAYKQTLRVLGMLDMLRGARHGVEVSRLAEELEVTERQIRRDLDALELAGYELERVQPESGSVRVRLADPQLRGIQITLRERYALLAARRAFDVLEHTPLHDDVRSIFGKIYATLPDVDKETVDGFAGRFAFLPDGGTKVYKKKRDVLDGLFTGVLRKLRVKYQYVRADGQKRGGLLEPYAIVVYRQGLYVLGRPAPGEHDTGNGAIRIYAAERFQRAEHLRGHSFEVPEGFSVDKYFHGVFGIFVGNAPTKVVIDLSKEVRGAIESRVFHPKQRLSRLADGGVRLSFTVPHTAQVVPWVLSWGDHARVVEPAELKAQVEDIVRRMAVRNRRHRLSGLPPALEV